MEIFIILVLLAINGLFAMLEIALVSSRKSLLQQKAQNGSRGATIALHLLKQPEKFLSTVQVGITLVGIIAGAYGGDAFTEDLKPFFEKFELTRNYAEEIAFISVVAVITYFSLIIGELVPKTIAMNNPEGITIAFAPFMRLFSVITYPIVAFLSISTKIFLKVLFIKERKDPPVTEEELKYMIETGSQHGIIEKQESDIMKSVFRFGDHTASSVMTHRTDIVWLNVHDTPEKILKLVHESTYSKYPVCDRNLDNLIGYITVKDILEEVQKGKLDVRGILREPIFITANTRALKILDTFRKKRTHIGYVINEFGGVEGLLTLHDLIENIVGEFPEMEGDDATLIQREDGSWLADGEIRIEELYKVLGNNFFPPRANYATLAGFILYELEKIPKAGDKFNFKDFNFEVLDMDGNRIDKILFKNTTE